MRALWSAVRETGKLFTSQRKLWLPFVIVAICEALFILLVWLAPHPPFSKLLAPPIRYFFNNRFLHYPTHLWFLFYVMKYTHVAASILAGAFFTGIACVMVGQRHAGESLSFRDALLSRRARYGRLLLVWAIAVALAHGLTTIAEQFGTKTPWFGWSLLGASVLLQGLLIYAIPAAVFNDAPWWKALGQSLREAVRFPFSTLALVAVTTLILLAFSLLVNPTRVNQWMINSEPEIALLWVAVRLVVLTVVDALLTVVIAHLWWLHRVPQQAVELAATSDAARSIPLIQEGPAVA